MIPAQGKIFMGGGSRELDYGQALKAVHVPLRLLTWRTPKCSVNGPKKHDHLPHPPSESSSPLISTEAQKSVMWQTSFA